jgi:hypothetical protein
MMSATKKLSAGVYQVIGTDWCVINDSHKCWWVAKVVDGLDSLELDERFFIGGTRNDAIQYAKELQVTQ